MSDERYICPHCGSNDVHQDSSAMGNRCYACGKDTKAPLEKSRKELAWEAYLAGVASAAKAWCPEVERKAFEAWWEENG